MSVSRGHLFALVAACGALARCQCDDGLTEIPRPEIDVCDEGGERCHDADTLTLTLALGAVTLGQTVETAFVVHNRGTQPLAVSRVALVADSESSADFSLTSGGFDGELAPESSQRFVVSYRPSDGGGDSATYEILSSDADEPRVLVVLSAQGDGPRICPAPPLVVSWGPVPVGTRVPQIYTFDSCGNQPLTIQRVQLADDAGGVFFIDDLPSVPLTLQPGARFDVELAFAPDAAQFFRGDLLIASDDVAAPEGHITLEGSGAACDLDAIPRQVSFGAVFQGVRETRDVLLRNNGSLDCTVSDITQASGSSEFSLATGFSGALAPGAQTTLSFAYEPSNSGADNAVFAVLSDDAAEPSLDIALQGQDAGRPQCLLELDPVVYDFGNVARSTRADGSLTLRNVGARACFALEFVMASGSSPAFGVDVPGWMSLGLQAGQSRSVDVFFEPLSGGAQTARLEVRVGLTRQLVTQTELRGNGSGAALCVDPDLMDFGVVDVGSSQSQEVTLSNCGNQPLDLSSLSLDGSGDFAFGGAAPTGTLQPGDSVTVTVVYTPGEAGRDDGRLKIVSDDPVEPTSSVDLIGHGVSPGTACGNIKGRICAPDGETWLDGATVSVDDGSGGQVQAQTDAQGRFVLTCVPVGTQSVTAQSGNWSTSFSAEVRDRETTELSTPQCVDPGSARVAVVLGCWDNMEQILDRLGAQPDIYDFDSTGEGCEAGGGSGGPNAADLLNNPAALASYDILFLNCGSDDTYAYNSTVMDNLRAFVSAGGSLMASDWAYDYVEQGWPDAVDFLGDDSQAGAAQTGTFGCRAEVVEPSLQSLLGVRYVDVNDAYTDIEGVASSTRTLLRCSDGSHAPNPQMVLFDSGQGHVAYTTFHNSSQSGSVIDKIFSWLIFHL